MHLTEQLENKLSSLPIRSGVYLMKDEKEEVIYVGKAKSLRHRVRSYFQNGADKTPKTLILVSKIVDVDYIVTNTEKEALILESNLIKQYQPRYNVSLKDDKSYPYIRFSVQEEYPRLCFTRQVEKDGALYFGPYVSAYAVREMLHILHRLFPLRHCEDSKFYHRTRPCMNSQLRRCLAPCCREVDRDEYQAIVQRVLLLLRGQDEELMAYLNREMERAAEALNYEKAAMIRDQMHAITDLLERQKIVSPTGLDQDVIGYYRQDTQVEFFVLFIRQGRMVGNQSFLLRQMTQDDEEVVSSFLMQYYREGRFIPHEVLIPLVIEDQKMIEEWLCEQKGKKVQVLHPQRAERKDLLCMANENAQITWENRRSKEERTRRTLEEMSRRLHLRTVPRAIECFDISNLSGTEAVGSMVRFENGEPVKAKYRHYRIRTIAQADDYGMMYEIIMRRLARGREEGDFPELFIVDGGKGQLQVARQAMSEQGVYDIDVIGLAKGRFHDNERTPEKVFLSGQKDPVILTKRFSTLHLLQRIRDESHRFAITYHRKLRQKKQRSSLLDSVPGIGPAKKQNLLRHFGSMKRIREAREEDLAAAPGISRIDARKIIEFFQIEE
ncbi:MAG TPA: excinuclease ABC subunit UvrC [Thermodesulfobacteriota bacterium]|nr:excinuclease ABC subunit UvrC [Thermodesulfobacteriota bacterium]HNU71559.1 excinuclease ABC subunit UvrC [Thermodesulfobacteriota bacterium]